MFLGCLHFWFISIFGVIFILGAVYIFEFVIFEVTTWTDKYTDIMTTTVVRAGVVKIVCVISNCMIPSKCIYTILIS